MKILTTKRLRLRPLAMADATALFAVLGDPVAMAFWDRAHYPRVGTVEAMLADELAAMESGTCVYWAVLRDDAVIGSIDLSQVAQGQAWTGFLFRSDVWGLGFAREALDAVIEDAFGRLGLQRLEARIQIGNSRAARLLEKCGFQRIGALPDVVRDGVARPCVRYRRDRSIAANGR